jgi:hypothetical protein
MIPTVEVFTKLPGFAHEIEVGKLTCIVFFRHAFMRFKRYAILVLYANEPFERYSNKVILP